MAVINRALHQLRSHRPACSCGLCGETVAKVKADRVYRTASMWQRSVVATRARMTRWRSPGERVVAVVVGGRRSQPLLAAWRQPELAARRKQLCASGFRRTQRRILTWAPVCGLSTVTPSARTCRIAVM
jgi:hypothetical protein